MVDNFKFGKTFKGCFFYQEIHSYAFFTKKSSKQLFHKMCFIKQKNHYYYYYFFFIIS